MDTLEFKKSVLKVNIYGEEVEINFPTLLEIKELSKKDNGDDIEKTIEFLDSLGLKKEISNKMEMHHLQKIVEVISSQKKI